MVNHSPFPTRRTENEHIMPVHVHIGNLAAQSGASLFLHTHSPPYRPHLGVVPPSISAAHPWIYNKTENLTLADIAYDPSFTHAIAEDTDLLPVRLYAVEAIDGFRGWKIRKDVLRLVRKNGLMIGLWKVFEMKKDIELFIFDKDYYNPP
jgi:alpha-1,6-mannosyltransferase